MTDVVRLAEQGNAAYARELRKLADTIEHAGEPVQGYAGIVVYGDGSIETAAHAERSAMLVGAIRLLEHRVIMEWDGV